MTVARSSQPPDRDPSGGVTMVELVVVLALAVSLIAVAVPAATAAIDAGRVRQAAGFVTSKFRLSRHRAIFGERSVALLFDQIGGVWNLRVCEDGDGDGIRRADVAAGTDPCPEGPLPFDQLFPTVAIALDPTIRDPGGGTGSSDPVRFGSSDLVSFSSDGSCTSGTLYLRSARGQQYAVRVLGITGRTRLLRHDPVSGQWFPW